MDKDGLRLKTFAWPLIIQAAGFAELSGTKLKLSAAGRKAALQRVEVLALQAATGGERRRGIARGFAFASTRCREPMREPLARRPPRR